MNTQNEKTTAESLLTNYAQALNSADATAIPTFYSPDGWFMPDGFRSLTTAELAKRSSSFLKKSQFHIEYSLQNTTIDIPFAFVEAIAQTRSIDGATGEELTQVSRDLFVLRKEQQEWKIFRYIFNHTEK